MSTNEEKLTKLKVPELKELLSKNNLVQTGKKDELVKRLLANNISADGQEDETEELTDPALTETTGEAYSAAPAAPSNGNEPITGSTDTPAAPAAASEQSTLTPEQQARKARAERFGLPFNPNPTPTNKNKTKSSDTKSPTASAKAAPAATVPETKTKSAGPIDKANLGIPDETLAKRAARFGLPEKKAEAPAAASTPSAATSAGKPKSAAPAAELTPEQAAKLAEDEEKKRKRAEKFGTASKPDSSSDEPDAKKVKV